MLALTIHKHLYFYSFDSFYASIFKFRIPKKSMCFCKTQIISVLLLLLCETDGKPHTSNYFPEEATHFSDTVDKRIWTKYGKAL